MRNKQNFRDSLIEIWQTEIKVFFQKGLICSERQLQSEIYHQLRKIKNLKIWIEPSLVLENHKLNNSKPDIIVTKGKHIIGIIELKYDLTNGIKFKFDIEKLIDYSSYKKAIPLETDLNTGDWKKNKDKYFIHEKCIYVFGAIGYSDSKAFNTESYKSFTEKTNSNFLILMGELATQGNQTEFHSHII